MRRLGFALLAAAALYAGPANAAQGLKFDGGQLTVHGIVAYYWLDTGFGVGARYQIPLVPEGFLRHPRVKDDLALDFGLDFVRVDWGSGVSGVTTTYDAFGIPHSTFTYDDFALNMILPSVGVLWNFWLTPNFALYPKVDLGYAFMWWSGDWYGGYEPSVGAFFMEGAAGAVYKMGSWSLKAEVGSGMLRVGAQFQM